MVLKQFMFLFSLFSVLGKRYKNGPDQDLDDSDSQGTFEIELAFPY